MSDRLKLLVVTHNYPRYRGDYAGVFLELLLSRLPEYGIDPVVVAPHDSECAEYEEIDGVKIYRFRYADNEAEQTLAYRGNMHQVVLGSVGGIFSFKRFLDCWRRDAAAVVKKEGIQILSGHWLVPAGMILKPLEKKTGLPVVLSSHGTDIRLMRKYFKVVYRYLKNFCLNLHRWTVVSSFLKNGIVELDDRLDAVIDVLPMPHNEKMFFKDDTVIKDDQLITSVTRFTDQKRVDVLIKAMALVSEKNPDTRLAIYGKGPLESELRGLVTKFGLDDVVTFNKPIPQPELRKVYNKAGIVVLNSVEEGFGLTLSEAMLCGTVVVGTASGGITDIIADTETGLLARPDDPSALADCLLSLLRDKSLRDRLAAAGHRYASETYTSEKSARNYAKLIYSAAGREFTF